MINKKGGNRNKEQLRLKESTMMKSQTEHVNTEWNTCRTRERVIRKIRGGGGGEFGTPTILVESSLLLTGVVHRCCQQLDAQRNCKTLTVRAATTVFVAVRKRSHKCVNRPQLRFDVSIVHAQGARLHALVCGCRVRRQKTDTQQNGNFRKTGNSRSCCFGKIWKSRIPDKQKPYHKASGVAVL